MVLGRAAYNYGERVNPISADKRPGDDVARWFMRDATREVYAQALALLDEATAET